MASLIVLMVCNVLPFNDDLEMNEKLEGAKSSLYVGRGTCFLPKNAAWEVM